MILPSGEGSPRFSDCLSSSLHEEVVIDWSWTPGPSDGAQAGARVVSIAGVHSLGVLDPWGIAIRRDEKPPEKVSVLAAEEQPSWEPEGEDKR